MLGPRELKAVGPAVIHLVGRLTDDVFSFLGPLTDTLGRKGIAQVVILRDDPAFRHLQAKFDPSVRLVLLPPIAGVFGRLRNMSKALRQEATHPTTVYCHLHGVIPSLVGAWALHTNEIGARLLFSPHGSRSLGPFKVVGAAILKLLKAAMPADAVVPIANSKLEARKIANLSLQAVAVIESPVHQVFFATGAREAEHPRVAAGAGLPDRTAAVRFAQLAVLFWDESVNVRFDWYGPVDGESRARLRAAGVEVHDTLGDTARAAGMASAWVYLSLGDGQGFPSLLAEAMALGLPCLGQGPTTDHDFIRHDLTGLVVEDEQAMLDSLALLIRSPDLRSRLGAAARSDAAIRFDRNRFDSAILGVYGRATSRLAIVV